MTNPVAPMQHLSLRTQQSVALMREEAHAYKQALIGTEHLLLGLIRTPTAAVGRIIDSFAVTLDAIREAIDLIAGKGTKRSPAAESGLNMTLRTHEVFALGDRLRHMFNHAQLEPEHLLLALLDIPGNAALGVLQTVGIERGPLRERTLDLMRMQFRAADDEPREPNSGQLTHLDAQGQARMVDVGAKADTAREAIARGMVVMRPDTLKLIASGEIAKGDVLATARIAGIMAAKQTSSLIPLCHPLLLTHVSVTLTPDEARNALLIEARVRTAGKTGVEMEALTAASVAALTIYDMCKAVDRGMRITDLRLAEKRGGKSGEIVLE